MRTRESIAIRAGRCGVSRTLALALVLLTTAGGAHAGDRASLPPDEPGWVLVANHLHSSPKAWGARPDGIRHIRGQCAKMKLPFAILTDHNTIAGWFDRSFTDPSPVTMVPGEEWTSDDGHANLVGYRAASSDDVIVPRPTPAGAIDHRAMVEEVHGRGGLVIINHPVMPSNRWPEDTHGADLCEVNKTWADPWGGSAKGWWVRRLVAGSTIGAIGGSDYHYLRPRVGQAAVPSCCGGPRTRATYWPKIEEPINLVRVDGPGLAALYRALARRHVQVLGDPRAPRCYVTVDASGDGRFDSAVAGDRLRTRPGQTLRIRTRVVGGRGQDLSIHKLMLGVGGRETITKIRIDKDDFTHVLETTAGGERRQAVFFEVGRLQALTNPVWY